MSGQKLKPLPPSRRNRRVYPENEHSEPLQNDSRSQLIAMGCMDAVYDTRQGFENVSYDFSHTLPCAPSHTQHGLTGLEPLILNEGGGTQNCHDTFLTQSPNDSSKALRSSRRTKAALRIDIPVHANSTGSEIVVLGKVSSHGLGEPTPRKQVQIQSENFIIPCDYDDSFISRSQHVEDCDANFGGSLGSSLQLHSTPQKAFRDDQDQAMIPYPNTPKDRCNGETPCDDAPMNVGLGDALGHNGQNPWHSTVGKFPPMATAKKNSSKKVVLA